MRFWKMHGLGNDFVVLDGTTDLAPDAATVAALCDRHRGIGADGVLRVTPTDTGARMEYWNADGGPAEMCGNGLRCSAWFAHRAGWVAAPTFTMETPRGALDAEVVGDHVVRVGMGVVRAGRSEPIHGVEGVRADVGNPHAVVEVASVDAADVTGIGEALDAAEPTGINTGFFERRPDGIRLRVHERGVGETLACGSGAVAAAAVALAGDGEMDVHLPGGTLHVEILGGRAWITGPVAEVFSGDWGVA